MPSYPAIIKKSSYLAAFDTLKRWIYEKKDRPVKKQRKEHIY